MFTDVADYESEPEPPPRPFKPWAALAAFMVALSVSLVLLTRLPGDELASPEELAQNFERMATRSGGLRTWDTPLRIALVGKGVGNYTGVVAEAAARFSALTGLDATIAPQGAETFNVAIELVPDREYGLIAARVGANEQSAEYLADHTLCYTVTQIQNVRARRATVVIPDDSPAYENRGVHLARDDARLRIPVAPQRHRVRASCGEAHDTQRHGAAADPL